MSNLNRTQIAVYYMSIVNTLVYRLVVERDIIVDHVSEYNVEAVNNLIDSSYKLYLKSPVEYFNSLNLTNVECAVICSRSEDIRQTKKVFADLEPAMDGMFDKLTADEALELQRTLNWKGMEIDFHARLVWPAPEGALKCISLV